jgi:hypothetical protein
MHGMHSHAHSQALVVLDVLCCSSIVADASGVCSIAYDSAAALWIEVDASETALSHASDLALLSARLLVRWRVSLQVAALTAACLETNASNVGQHLRLCDTLKKQLERWDYSLLQSLPRVRACMVLAYLPHLILSIASDKFAVSKSADPRAVAALEHALTMIFHNLDNLGSLGPVLQTLALPDMLATSLASLRAPFMAGASGVGAKENAGKPVKDRDPASSGLSHDSSGLSHDSSGRLHPATRGLLQGKAPNLLLSVTKPLTVSPFPPSHTDSHSVHA